MTATPAKRTRLSFTRNELVTLLDALEGSIEEINEWHGSHYAEDENRLYERVQDALRRHDGFAVLR